MEKKGIAVAVVFLFIVVSIAPVISGTNERILNNLNFETINSTETKDEAPLSFYFFDRGTLKQSEVVLSTNDTKYIIDMFKRLNNEMARCPISNETQELKYNFIALLNEKKLIPEGFSKEKCMSLLNPYWLEKMDILDNYSTVSQPIFSNIAWAFLCQITSGGYGGIFPFILFPRPRAIALWKGRGSSNTNVVELLRPMRFDASQEHNGMALGFTGIGVTYLAPYWPYSGIKYDLSGYALMSIVHAEKPPNEKPIITLENPQNRKKDVQISCSKISFRIEDPNGNYMGYNVWTEPDIGSGSDSWVKDGVYSIPISELQYDEEYIWHIEVTDGKEVTKKDFSFTTESPLLDPFDPFNEGWSYRKKITINHSKVEGNITNYPLLVSIIDNDLVNKAQNDGDDILFMSRQGYAVPLYHEIEEFTFYDPTGKLVAWVNVRNLSSTSDIELYMYYGNPDCGNQQNVEKTWNRNFIAVWHLNNRPGSILDSTIYGCDAEANNMNSLNLVQGKVGKCLNFDGINDFVVCTSYDILTPSEVTLICWLYPRADCTGFWHVGKQTQSYWGDRNRLSYGTLYKSKKIQGILEKKRNPRTIVEYDKQTNTYEWYHIALNYDSDFQDVAFYVDGIRRATDHRGEGLYYSGGHFYMGGSTETYFVNRFEDCMIDEVWVADIDLSDEWISTLYQNQNDPLNFINVGPEESAP
jgi:hypothetical protein